jgi:hypothetical protein
MALLFQALFLFDVSAIVLMVILAYLSKRLGEALKIPPYYRLFYATALLVLVASGLDTLEQTAHAGLLPKITMAVRAVSAAAALVVCLPYWKWLFSEYFLNKR